MRQPLRTVLHAMGLTIMAVTPVLGGCSGDDGPPADATPAPTPVPADAGDGAATVNEPPDASPEASAPVGCLKHPCPVKIVVDSWHACAVMDDGTARCWGHNDSGELGDGTTVDRSVPTPVMGLTGVTDMVLGLGWSCALSKDGTVRCWGMYGYPETTPTTAPEAIVGVVGAKQLSGGTFSACARLDNGSVQCWGNNGYGELGNGKTGASSRASVQVTLLGGVKTIAAHGHNVCAALTDGTARCWGNNAGAALGDGTTTNRPTPVGVQGLRGVASLHGSEETPCAILDDGSARCWGKNDYSQIGDGTNVDRPEPTKVGSLSGVLQLSGRGCALMSGAGVQCWGAAGLAGTGTAVTARMLPQPIQGATTATQLVAGAAHHCARLADGTVQCWGLNNYGQLGSGSTKDPTTPVQVRDLAKVTAVFSGRGFTSFALLSDGTVQGWGRNDYGQVGDGTKDTRSAPVAVAF